MNSHELFSKLKKLRATDKVLLLTHTDADGAGPEILLNYVIDSSNNITVKHLNNSVMSQEIRKAVCSDIADNYDTIIACDISCSKEDTEIIAADKNSAKLIILDHHLSSSHLNNYPSFAVSCSSMVDDSFRAALFKNCGHKGLSSGTSLMYDYLHYVGLVDKDCEPNQFSPKEAVLREIVHLITTYDTWDWVNCFNKNPRYLQFNRLFDIYGNDYYVSIMLSKAYDGFEKTIYGIVPVLDIDVGNAYLLNKTDEHALAIDDKKRQTWLEQAKSAIHTGSLTLRDNRTYSIAYADNNKYTDDVFELMKQTYPDIDLYMINYGSGISMRSVKENVNVSEIAKLYKGGGHMGAGGFKIPTNDIIDMLKKTMDADIVLDIDTSTAANENAFNEYKVNIKETLLRTVTISAKSSDDALAIAENMVNNGEIVLECEDFFDRDISLESDNTLDNSGNDEICSYCRFDLDTGANMNNCGDDFVLIHDKEDKTVSIATDDKHFRTLNIQYCPMCGRKLTSKTC